MPGYADLSHIPKDLGRHFTGRSRFCIRPLDAVDLDVLGRFARAGLDDLGQTRQVRPR